MIELLVVIAVLGVLVLLAAPRFLGKTQSAFETSIIHDARLVQDATERYYLDNGEFPFRYETKDGERVRIEAGTPSEYEILHKVENFDNDNPNVKMYEIDFRELDEYVKINTDEGYFLAARGNPEFGITALKPGVKSTTSRLSKKESDGSQEDFVESEIPSKENGFTIWKSDQLDIEAFDKDDSSFSTISRTGTSDVTWDGDLTNNVIELVMGTTGGRLSSTVTMRIYDEDDNVLRFIDAETDESMNRFFVSSTSEVTKRIKFIMPKDAVKLSFTSTDRNGHLYELRDYEHKELPLRVSNITSENNRDNIVLSWTNLNEDDFDRVAIYRDNKFVGYSHTNEYIDKPLYSDREYKYTVQVIDKIGNRSETVEYKAKTIVNGAIWRGLSPEAFDRDEKSFSIVPSKGTSDVTWDGDLTNNVIELIIGTTGGRLSSTVAMRIYDEDDNVLSFIDADTDKLMNRFFVSSTSEVTKRIKFIMPKDAVRLSFTSTDRNGHVFEVRD